MLRGRVGVGERERYERVDPSHSWNSNNIATNVLLYHLQRHSDHHANPTRRYQALRDFEESPVLPTGYAGMILLAAFPPVWRRVMDPRVLAHFGGDVSRANLSPRRARPTWPGTPCRWSRSERSERRHRWSRSERSERLETPCSPPAVPGAATPTRWRPGTSARGSRPAPHGATYPRGGPARTAGCGTRTTSCRWSPEVAGELPGRSVMNRSAAAAIVLALACSAPPVGWYDGWCAPGGPADLVGGRGERSGPDGGAAGTADRRPAPRRPAGPRARAAGRGTW